MYGTLGPSNFHVGDAPKDTRECLKRFCLQMGVSVSAFLGQKHGGRPSNFASRAGLASRAGPRGIKEGAPVNNMFTSRYVENSERFD